MKRIIVSLVLLAAAGLWAPAAGAGCGGAVTYPVPGGLLNLPDPQLPPPGVELEMLILEGVRDVAVPPAKVVTSSFLRFLHYKTLQPEEGLGAEQQIKQVFNLKDARLINAVNLRWEKGKSEKAFHVFRLDSREYVILVTPGKAAEPRQFHIEVLEQGAKDKASLLDMEFNIPQRTAAVFGFEDTQGKPYFLSFKVLRAAPETTLPPKLIKIVDPVYPESARSSNVQGSVVLEVTTDTYGRVVRAAVVRSVPPLDQAAMDALLQWAYEPAVVDGEPRSVTFTVTIRFNLVDGKGVTGILMGGVTGGVEGGVAGGVVRTVPVAPVQPMVRATGQEKAGPDKDAVRVKDRIRPPKRVNSVEPVYPEAARKAQVEGVVILEATMDEEGNIESVKVLRSIPILDSAAVDAVKQWKYEPMVINGKRTKAIFTVTVRFMLDSGDKQKDLDKFAQGAVKAEGAVKPPKLVKLVEPVYPEEARKSGVEGVVILAAKTDATGRVQDVLILRSIPQLNQAAIDAVKQWIYEPMVIDGVATTVVFTVTVRFQIPDKEKEKEKK